MSGNIEMSSGTPSRNSGGIGSQPRPPYKLLVIEDEAAVALDIQEALTENGYQVVGHAINGRQAIELAQKHQPDLVLMDIVLDGEMDGITAAQQIANFKHPIPIVFLTAYSDESLLQRAKLCNPYGYVIKPFDPDDLRAAIEIALFRFASEGAAKRVEDEVGTEEEPIAAEHTALKTHSGAAERLAFLEKVPLFHDLPPAILQQVADMSFVRELEGGELLNDSEIIKSYIGIVVSGRVAIIQGTSSGKELIVSLLAPGDSYGLRALFGVHDDEAFTRAQVDSKILLIPNAQLRLLIRENTVFSVNLATELSVRLQRAQQLASSLAHSKVENRIISTLLALVPDFGKTAPQGTAVRIYITRKELADLTGTTPETAIRVTKQLERDKHLDLSRPGIIKIPNPATLAKLIS